MKVHNIRNNAKLSLKCYTEGNDMKRPTITIEQKGLKKEVNPRQRMLSLVEKVTGRVPLSAALLLL
jgi:hypothetical protein